MTPQDMNGHNTKVPDVALIMGCPKTEANYIWLYLF